MAAGETNEMWLDPRNFITGPFKVCPECGTEALGLLSVNQTSAHRRCRVCRFDVAVSLPPQPARKLVYLDQFAISDIAKILYAKDPANARVDPDWREIFIRLNRLSQLGVIACPSSPFHDSESEVSPASRRLRRLLIHLSGGIHFRHHYDLWGKQMFDVAKRLASRDTAPLVLDRQAAVNGSLTGWRDKLTIDLMGNRPADEIAEATRRQDANHEGFLKSFDEWKLGRADVPFGKRFSEFVHNYGILVVSGYKHYIDQRVATGFTLPPGLDYVTRSHLVDLFEDVVAGIRAGGIAGDHECMDAAVSFLLEDGLQQVPYVRAQCSLLSALQQKAAAGQSKAPTRGIMNDILAIATYAPYCEAIVIDNQCRGMLVEKHMEPYRPAARTYSFKTREAFVTFLDVLEDGVAPEHRALLEDLYGPSWAGPFLGVLDAEDWL